MAVDPSLYHENLTAVASEPNGEILAAGSGNANGSNQSMILALFQTNGSLDKNFGVNGVVVNNFNEASGNAANAIALQSNGQIVLAGSVLNQMALTRYNANGTIDSNFGTNGLVIVPFSSPSDGTSVAIDNKSNIIVAGSGDSDFALARYTSSGAVDKSFGTNGVVETNLGSSSAINGIAIQPADGKIVAVGPANSQKYFAVVRYNTDGTLDTSFNGTGEVLDTFPNEYVGFNGNDARGVALQPDGKIVAVGGFIGAGGANYIAVARYNSNGTPDTSFNGTGKISKLLGLDDIANAVTTQGNGKIVVVGSVGIAGGSPALTMRYNPDGTLDSGFGAGGVATTKISSDGNDGGYSVFVAPDGTIVTGGTADSGTDSNMVLLRYVGDPAISPTGVNVAAAAQAPFSGTVANFTTADAQLVASQFSASINWGDTATSAGTVKAGPNGSFMVTGSHTYMASGRYTATVTINGPMSTMAKAGFTAAVTATPSLSTIAGGTILLGSGAKMTDTAQLSGGNQPTGTITFNLHAPDGKTIVDTETVPVAGDGLYKTPNGYVPSAVGTYVWVASYSGDANNNPVASQLPQPIPLTVFDTGVNNSGIPLPDGSIDPHYKLIASADPSNPGPNSFVIALGNLPWMPDSSTSKWISSTSQNLSVPGGFFDYQMTFDLSGLDPSTAQLTGRFSTDDEMFDVFINGQSTGINNGFTGTGQFTRWTAFTISSGFQAGTNTIVFHTHNDLGATGVRVELAGTAKPPLGTEAEKVIADTMTAIGASNNAAVLGETVTYTATISGIPAGAGSPASGTVTFSFDGAQGISANVVGGRATLLHQWSSTGPHHTVDAMYNGDDRAGDFAASKAPQLVVAVSADTTTTTIHQPVTNILNPGGTDTYLHQSATFTAIVQSTHGATPTGSIAFLDGTITLKASVGLSSSGSGLATATFSTASLSPGMHLISAVYTDDSGDHNFQGSASGILVHTVDFHPLQLTQGVAPAGFVQSPFVDVNGKLFFTANDLAHGEELWESNGNPAGTVLVKDVNPGIGGSYPSGLTNVNGVLFFAANDGIHGAQLWKSNGTTAGTVLVSDINPAGGAYPTNLTNISGTLFFSATNGSNGQELWRSNGLPDGTMIVKDIDPGPTGSDPSQLTNVSGTLFFAANDGTHGTELFRSNGTSQGTVLIKDIRHGSNGSYPDNLTNINGTLFFSADNGVSGVELWRTDGTRGGTLLIKDIHLGSIGSYPAHLTNVNGTCFFVADDGRHGPELFRSDGTGPGTVLVKDINPGSAGSSPSNLTNVNGTLFFSANDGVSGQELWRSNGLSAGTFLVKDINLGAIGSYPSQLTNVNGTLFFVANDGVHGNELFESNGVGTGSGTLLVADLDPGPAGSAPGQLTNLDGTLFFSADDGQHGRELWMLSL
jgi:uncharacterized delta-60 repeat protein